MTFTNLGLSQKVLDAIVAAGFDKPTPIQAQAIPAANLGRDIVGIAQTGTGKTASFVLPMLTRLEAGRARARMPRSLILEPTRELAAQVHQAFEQLGVNHKLTVALLIGGVSFEDQNRKLDRGADVLIATPGRLLDHHQRGRLLMSAVEILVIDEADRMLDMGFIPDIEKICKTLPTARQTLFFSATMPKEVKKLADKFLNDPLRIEVAPQSSAAKTITQRLKFASSDVKMKREILRDLINVSDVKNAIIFCNRKRDVGILLKSLLKHGYNAGGLHGDMEQRDRTATLDAFRKGDISLLAASDVAARGLDIPDVSHIFNFDVPITPEDYIHRIGRTGRAGKEGYAATLVTASDLEAVRAIEKLCREKIEWLGGEPSSEDIEEGRRAGALARRAGGRSSAGGRTSSRRGGDKAQRPEAAVGQDEKRGPRRSRGGGDKPQRVAETVAVAQDEPQGGRRRRSDGDRAPKPETVGQDEPKVARRGRGGSGRQGRGASSEEASRVWQPEIVVRDQERRPPPERHERPRRGRDREEPAPLGMGEHVPAFLLTPIKRSK
jgi:superfamily II DNA/RNA helicase